MKRREFVTKAGITTAAVAAVNGCGSKSVEGPNVQTRKTVRWDLASSFPKSLDTIFAAWLKIKHPQGRNPLEWI